MRFIKSALKYFLFFVLGTVVSAFLIATAASYLVIENLAHELPTTEESKATAAKNATEDAVKEDPTPHINANFLELSVIGASYVKELSHFDELHFQLTKEDSISDVCKVVCNATSLDAHRMSEERTDYLVEYFKKNRHQALADPQFHIKLREIGFLSSLFPHSYREIFINATSLRGTSASFSQKLTLAFQLEGAAFKEVFTVKQKIHRLRRNKRDLYAYRNLVSACRTGKMTRKQTLTKCEARFPRGLE